MPITRDTALIARFRKPETYISFYDSTGGTWGSLQRLPDEATSKIKPELDNWEVENVGGQNSVELSTEKKLIYTSQFNQRDAETFKFPRDNAAVLAVLLVVGPNFNRLQTPKQQYWALHGAIVLSDGEIDLADGKSDFIFKTSTNDADITIVSAGDIEPPTGHSTLDMTITQDKMYEVVDV